MKSLTKDDSAQIGGIIMLVLGIFAVGAFYIILSGIMNMVYDQNNIMIAGNMPYSQDRKDAMSSMFLSWWAIPIYAILVYIIWGIKNAIESSTSEAY